MASLIRAVNNMMVGRIGVERPELVVVLYGTELQCIEAIRIEFGAQHVVDADL
jgi:hypothetical protein